MTALAIAWIVLGTLFFFYQYRDSFPVLIRYIPWN
jgi:hypothetical protein